MAITTPITTQHIENFLKNHNVFVNVNSKVTYSADEYFHEILTEKDREKFLRYFTEAFAALDTEALHNVNNAFMIPEFKLILHTPVLRRSNNDVIGGMTRPLIIDASTNKIIQFDVNIVFNPVWHNDVKFFANCITHEFSHVSTILEHLSVGHSIESPHRVNNTVFDVVRCGSSDKTKFPCSSGYFLDDKKLLDGLVSNITALVEDLPASLKRYSYDESSRQLIDSLNIAALGQYKRGNIVTVDFDQELIDNLIKAGFLSWKEDVLILNKTFAIGTSNKQGNGIMFITGIFKSRDSNDNKVAVVYRTLIPGKSSLIAAASWKPTKLWLDYPADATRPINTYTNFEAQELQTRQLGDSDKYVEIKIACNLPEKAKFLEIALELLIAIDTAKDHTLPAGFVLEEMYAHLYGHLGIASMRLLLPDVTARRTEVARENTQFLKIFQTQRNVNPAIPIIDVLQLAHREYGAKKTLDMPENPDVAAITADKTTTSASRKISSRLLTTDSSSSFFANSTDAKPNATAISASKMTTQTDRWQLGGYSFNSTALFAMEVCLWYLQGRQFKSSGVELYTQCSLTARAMQDERQECNARYELQARDTTLEEEINLQYGKEFYRANNTEQEIMKQFIVQFIAAPESISREIKQRFFAIHKDRVHPNSKHRMLKQLALDHHQKNHNEEWEYLTKP